jgi:antitoxin component HigA of HigAB toxin-antitoxin module
MAIIGATGHEVLEARTMLEPRIIKTEKPYRAFLKEVERFAVSDPDPVEAIEFRMEQQGLLQKNIAPLLGGKNRASEILSRKRPAH